MNDLPGLTHSNGPRFGDDGRNFDNDIIASFPRIKYRQITDPVSDGSLGEGGYARGQKNRDGSDL